MEDMPVKMVSAFLPAAAWALCAMLAAGPVVAQRDDHPAAHQTFVTTGAEGDQLRAGQTITIESPVAGDLAVAGRDVTVSQGVDGYLLAAGADVTIDGRVGDDLWAAGRSVRVGGPVRDSVRAAGGFVLVQPQARIGGDALLAGRRVEVRGPVAHDLQVSGSAVTIASEIGGSVRARTADLTLLPGAVVHGNLETWGPRPPRVVAGAQVLGSTQHHAAGSNDDGPSVLGWLGWWAFGFVALLLLGAVTIAFARSWSSRVAAMEQRLGWSLLTGFVALFAIPLLAALLMGTLIGLPLGIVVMALYGIALLLSGVFASLRLGGWLLARAGRPNGSRHAQLALGALALSLLGSLPWLGSFVWFFVAIAGLGAWLLERRQAWANRGLQPAA